MNFAQAESLSKSCQRVKTIWLSIETDSKYQFDLTQHVINKNGYIFVAYDLDQYDHVTIPIRTMFITRNMPSMNPF